MADEPPTLHPNISFGTNQELRGWAHSPGSLSAAPSTANSLSRQPLSVTSHATGVSPTGKRRAVHVAASSSTPTLPPAAPSQAQPASAAAASQAPAAPSEGQQPQLVQQLLAKAVQSTTATVSELSLAPLLGTDELPSIRGKCLLPNEGGPGSPGRNGGYPFMGGLGLEDWGGPQAGFQPDTATVDRYLERFHLHQTIRQSFATKGRDHAQFLEQLGSKIEGFSRTTSPQRDGEEASGAREGRHSGEGAAPAAALGGGAAGGERERVAFAGSPHHSPARPGTANSAGSADAGDGPSPSAAAAAAARQPLQQAHAQQLGAYLSSPEYSFAGRPPLKAAPAAGGVLFEPYNSTEQIQKMPGMQALYLRPQKVWQKPHAGQPRIMAAPPRQTQPPGRALPNGIPQSRLENLNDRRSGRSPARRHLQPAADYVPPRNATTTTTTAAAATATSAMPSPRGARLASATAQRPDALPSGSGLPPPHALIAPAPRSLSVPAGGTAATILIQSQPSTSALPLPTQQHHRPARVSGPSSAAAGAAAPQQQPPSHPLAGSPSQLQLNAQPSGSIGLLPADPSFAATATTTSPGPLGLPHGTGRHSGSAALLPLATAPGTGEPLLDDQFFAVLQQHFRGTAQRQTEALRSRLNVNLPVVLQAMNCVNVVEQPGMGASAALATRQ